MANNSVDFWSITANDNDALSPNGAPNNWVGTNVNDTVRELMAVMRTWYDNPEWISITRDLNGGTGKTIDYVATNQFRINSCDATAYYTAGRRVRMRDAGGEPYEEGIISGSTYSDPNTLVTIIGANVPNPMSDDGADVYILKTLDPSAFVSTPGIGDVKLTAGLPAVAAVNGWFECNGQELVVATYPELAALLGSTGNDDGHYDEHPTEGFPSANSFRVPDLRGRVPVGYWDNTGPGGADPDLEYNYITDQADAWVGSKKHLLDETEMPAHDHGEGGAHTHEYESGNIAGGSGVPKEVNPDGVPSFLNTEEAGAHTHTEIGGGLEHENRQASIVMGYVIYSGVT
jgi:microcystin-dependent protein